ncbi:MAG TPA: TCR/Tet family MFS transporter [Sphingomonas sp.]|uniref:TCR/Tet family MFS transporter n=1 Tax=Sphingomonas sp. TaxID=28214 RepID=UPI002C2CB294|nr:TCR/Tet family MFS transporter [Sphingomonas sp.]HMI20600.1 TCR/Tet family MFS transporter [Sphingomonas sp.]
MSVSNRSAVRFVVLTVLIDAIGFGIVMPVLPGIVMKLGHVGLAEATRIGGWLGVIYAAVQFLSGPMMGNLGDRFGRRPIILGALAGFAIDYALMGFAPTLGWLFLGRALAGLFGASFGPAGAAMADLSAPEERAKHFGMIGGAFGVGFVIGPAIGGLLGEIGPRWPFYAAAVLAAGNFLLGLFAFPETHAAENRRPFQWKRANPLGALIALRGHKGVLPVAFASFWWALASMIYPTTWAFFAIAAFNWTPGLIGASLALVGLLMALSQVLLVGRVVKRFGERRSAEIGIGFAMCGFIAYALLRNGWFVFPVLALTAMQSLVMPSMSGLMSRRVPADAQGELQGFSGSIAALAAIIAPAIYSPALAWFTGPRAPFWFPGIAFAMATVAALVALITLILMRRAPQIPPATGA